MAKNLSLSPSLRWLAHSLTVHSLESPLDFHPIGIVHSFTLIAQTHGSGRFLIGRQILHFYLIKLFWNKV